MITRQASSAYAISAFNLDAGCSILANQSGTLPLLSLTSVLLRFGVERMQNTIAAKAATVAAGAAAREPKRAYLPTCSTLSPDRRRRYSHVKMHEICRKQARLLIGQGIDDLASRATRSHCRGLRSAATRQPGDILQLSDGMDGVGSCGHTRQESLANTAILIDSGVRNAVSRRELSGIDRACGLAF